MRYIDKAYVSHIIHNTKTTNKSLAVPSSTPCEVTQQTFVEMHASRGELPVWERSTRTWPQMPELVLLMSSSFPLPSHHHPLPSHILPPHTYFITCTFGLRNSYAHWLVREVIILEALLGLVRMVTVCLQNNNPSNKLSCSVMVQCFQHTENAQKPTAWVY